MLCYVVPLTGVSPRFEMPCGSANDQGHSFEAGSRWADTALVVIPFDPIPVLIDRRPCFVLHSHQCLVTITLTFSPYLIFEKRRDR